MCVSVPQKPLSHSSALQGFPICSKCVCSEEGDSFPLGAQYPAALSSGQEPECLLPAVGLDVLKVHALICVGGHR